MGAMYGRCTIALAFVLGACGAADAVDTEDSAPPTAIATVPGVGELPDTIPVPTLDADDAEEPEVSVVVTRPVDDEGVVVESVAERVNGNRLLVIGDSILASTATRYGKELCEALNPIGWTVEVDAEPGRFVEFGNEVAEARLDVDDDDDFDAVVIHLGSNYGRDKDAYFDELSELLYRAAPRPTLLLTVTEYRPQWSEVNDVIDDLAPLYDNVTVIDWEKIARSPGVLSRDGLHPGDQGEAVLVEQIAVALGELATDVGDCLSSPFTDDSAIRQSGGSSGSSSGSSSGGSSSGSSSGGSSSSGTSSGGSSSGGSSTGSSAGSTSGTTGTSGGTSSGTTTGTGVTTTVGTTGGTTSGGTTGTTGGTTTTDGTGGTTSGGTTGDTTSGGTTDTTSGGTTGGTTSGGTTDTTSGGTTGGTTSGGTTGTTGGTSSGGSSTSSTSGGAATGGAATGGTPETATTVASGGTG